MAARKLDRAQEFAKDHSIARAYGSYEELATDQNVGEYQSQSQSRLSVPFFSPHTAKYFVCDFILIGVFATIRNISLIRRRSE